MMMTAFDAYVIRFLNSYANRWQPFDSVIVLVRATNLLKGGVIAALIWWAWFRTKGDQKRTRAVILSTLVAAFGAMFTARGLALILPFRYRPIHNAEIGFQLPYGMIGEALDGWSSFPSDHAALFVCLTVGLWFVSRRLGTVALLHTLVVISFPRLYLGLHYPTDILGGAVIGVAWFGIANMAFIENLVLPAAMLWLEKHPMSFYAAFFLLTEQIATIFEDARTVARMILAVFARRF
jgi:membrane-associated phospholipid phosphatase